MSERIGILGGGQLGRMLLSAGNQLDMDISFMDNMSDGPVANVSKQYSLGDIQNKEDVLAFGADKDILSIEIERVNTEALTILGRQGKKVYAQPEVINIIQDKGLQKEFYKKQGLPTSNFQVYDHLSSLIHDLDEKRWTFPFVQKIRKDGYDGRGVQIIKSNEDLDNAFPYNFIIEEKVAIEKELAIVTCRDQKGNIVCYDPVEMIFHPEANILLYQLAPATISPELAEEARKIAIEVTKAYKVVGLLAIELFLDKSGKILINEVAPRPHNSGHHTIEATLTSQYENQLRAITGLPLGATDTISNSLLMNILGDEKEEGPVHYKGLSKVLEKKGVNIHLYGKTTTKPFRKMGHINILGNEVDDLIDIYNYINKTLKVVSK